MVTNLDQRISQNNIIHCTNVIDPHCTVFVVVVVVSSSKKPDNKQVA